jgi:antitoxin (DNA-binding transcriptional repressor) of toxin-antitoxin stability system
VLAKVEAGETVEITNRGRLVARIVPASAGELDDLVAAGRVVPASVHVPFVTPGGAVEPGADAGELLSTLRDEERW